MHCPECGIHVAGAPERCSDCGALLATGAESLDETDDATTASPDGDESPRESADGDPQGSATEERPTDQATQPADGTTTAGETTADEASSTDASSAGQPGGSAHAASPTAQRTRHDSGEAARTESATAASTPAAAPRVDSDRSREYGPLAVAREATGTGLVDGATVFLTGIFLTGLGVVVEATTAASDGPGMADGLIADTVGRLALGVQVESVALAEQAALSLVKLVGWVFLNAHQVPVTVDGESRNLLVSLSTGPDAVLTSVLYYAVPPILLTYGGWLVVRSVGIRTLDGGALAGATVAVGYAPLAGLVALLAGFQSAGPSPVSAFVLAGLYAVVFGAAGGFVAAVLAQRPAGPSVTRPRR